MLQLRGGAITAAVRGGVRAVGAERLPGRPRLAASRPPKAVRPRVSAGVRVRRCVVHGPPFEPRGWWPPYTAAEPDSGWGWVRRQTVAAVDDLGILDVTVPDFSDAPAFDLRPGAAGPATAPAPAAGGSPSAARTRPDPNRSGGVIDVYAVADSLPLAASGLLPLLWVGRRCVRAVRRHERSKGGLCPSCGYDLRATPGRCPECGHVPAGEVSPWCRRVRDGGAVSSPHMKRLLPSAFNLAALVSAVLLVGVCVLWVRSYRRIDGVMVLDAHGVTELFTYGGGFWIGRMDLGLNGTYGVQPLPKQGNDRASQTFVIFGDRRNWAGFASCSGRGTEVVSRITLHGFPLWPVPMTLLLLPALTLARRSRQGSRPVARPLPLLRLRPSRHPRPLPGVPGPRRSGRDCPSGRLSVQV